MKPAVLCLRPQADFARAGVAIPDALEVTYRSPTDADVPAALREADALVIPAVGPKLEATLFAQTKLRLIQVTGAGVDRLDRAAITARGIAVANVPGGSNRAVAEYAVTTAATLLRRFTWSSAEIRGGRYTAFRARLLSDNVGGLDGLLVGIVGLGTIGKAVAEAFAASGCRIAFHDPVVRDAAMPGIHAEALALDELVARSDVLTLHVPLSDATRGLIGARELARMKPGAVLINAARGGVVDELALAAALTEGRLAGAAVDVYAEEPPPSSNPLLVLSGEAADRLILTPHIAGVTRQASAYLFSEAWRNVARVLLDREPPRFRVY